MSSRQALWLLHLAVLLFGASGLIGKAVSSPALVVTCLRSLVASVVLCAVLSRRGGFPWRKVLFNGGWLAVGGALLAVHWWTFFAAIQLSTVALGLLTFASYPLFASVLAWVCLRETPSVMDLVACAAVVVGLALVVPGWDFGSQAGMAGALGVASGVTFAGLTLVNRRLAVVVPPLGLVAAQTGVAGLLLLPGAAGLETAIAGRDWILLILLGVVFTGLAHACFTASLVRVRVATASVTTALEPVYGIAFAWLLLGERPSVIMLLGGVLIFGAAVLCTGGGRERE